MENKSAIYCYGSANKVLTSKIVGYSRTRETEKTHVLKTHVLRKTILHRLFYTTVQILGWLSNMDGRLSKSMPSEIRQKILHGIKHITVRPYDVTSKSV